MCRQRHTSLGSFIAAVSKKFDYPLPACDGLLQDEMFYHHIVMSCPRGKFRILSSNVVTVVLEIALCRGLYLVDSVAAFHPYSQVTSSTHIDKLQILKPLKLEYITRFLPAISISFHILHLCHKNIIRCRNY